METSEVKIMTAPDTTAETTPARAGTGATAAGASIQWHVAGTDLVVHVLEDDQWVIRDGTLPQTDPYSLLGFVEKNGDRFQATTLYPAVKNKHGFTTGTFPSLEAVIGHFAIKLDRRRRNTHNSITASRRAS